MEDLSLEMACDELVESVRGAPVKMLYDSMTERVAAEQGRSERWARQDAGGRGGPCLLTLRA